MIVFFAKYYIFNYHIFRWLYGLLSFPWLLFALSIIGKLLTKARPTFYDKKGNCIPKKV